MNEWLDIAKQLGALEEQKAQLFGPTGNTALEISQARYGWVSADENRARDPDALHHKVRH